MVFPAVLVMTFCLSPLVVTKQHEAQQQMNEVLAQWEVNAKVLKSACFDIKTSEKCAVSDTAKEGFITVHLLIKSSNEYLLKMEVFNSDREPTSTFVLRGKEVVNFDFKDKRVIAMSEAKAFSLEGLQYYSEIFFAAYPFFIEKNKMLKQCTLSVARKDEHYTWVRFNPKEGNRWWTIAQVGAINYASEWGPRYFPFVAMWRDTAGNIVTWTFKKVVINDDKVINEKVFYDEEQLLKSGWKLSKSSTLDKKTTEEQK